MPRGQEDPPQYDERTLMLFEMSDELERRANEAIKDLDAVSKQLSRAIELSRVSDARITSTLRRTREEHTAEYRNRVRHDEGSTPENE